MGKDFINQIFKHTSFISI
uniref:Uncharacterized protein n=1 Tax=Anguilla anguilla TaxID=7936 RepID=A0A0E9UBG4_ANGAN